MINQNILLIGGIILLGVWALYKLNRDFNERLFFKIGLWLFLIQALANVWGFVIEYSITPLWAMVAKVGNILFLFVIAYFFYYLMKKVPASMGGAGTTLSPEQINDFMKGELSK